MRRITYWALSTLSALVLLLGYHTSLSGPSATGSPTSIVAPVTGAASTSSGGTTTSSGTNPPDQSTGASSSASSPASATPKASTKATTSTVTGSVAQTRWGPVQVQLTVSGSKVTKVAVTQYPNGNGRDEEINSSALPVLIQETLDAQSAQIDMVSGATVTSGGYLESLQSALDQAHL
jgi:uncharacterized protein with FMN-binding domain